MASGFFVLLQRGAIGDPSLLSSVTERLRGDYLELPGAQQVRIRRAFSAAGLDPPQPANGRK